MIRRGLLSGIVWSWYLLGEVQLSLFLGRDIEIFHMDGADLQAQENNL